MQKFSQRTQSFAGFTLDLTRGCLLRGGQEIKLPPKPFEALKYLVDNAGRLVSKAELMNAIWPDTAVTDDSLVQCVREVRRALSDDAQAIVRTVPRRGYIFDKPVASGPTSVTTYTEETGVQVIIEEEETDGEQRVAASALPAAVAPTPEHKVTTTERLTTAIKQHRRITAGAFASLVLMATAIVYLSRPGEAIDSIAVMPFVNVNGDPNAEYLSDGISESIINRISPNLKVIALNTVLRYKGKQTDPQAVGRELKVGAVLMGRVMQRGDDLLINVELVEVRNNRHLWGQEYKRNLADITAVPAEIAQEVSEELRLQLSGEDRKRLSKHYTESGEAYQLYMMGRHYRGRWTKEGIEKSIEYFEQAIKKDPGYAPAYAALGISYGSLGWTGLLPPKEARQKEEWAGLKALELDDSLAEAHVAMAWVRQRDLNWAASEEEFQRALQLDPNSAGAHVSYAYLLEGLGRLDEALIHLQRAQVLDPLSLNIRADIEYVLYFLRQYDKAIELAQKTIEMDPNFAPAHVRLAVAYLAKGMYEEAITEHKKAIALDESPGRWGRSAALGYAYAEAGKRGDAQKIFDELKELSKQRYVSPFNFALIYIGLGEKDLAFEWLNKTYDEYPDTLLYLKVDRRFDSLRSDPRFTELLKHMKLA